MMSGMLVPVERRPVEKSMEAVASLFGVDPEFITLCKVLYGPDVDPIEVWSDVFGKDEPSGADMHVPGSLQTKRGRKRAVAAAALGSTLAGGVVAGQKLLSSTGRGRLLPAAALGGDLIATEELGQRVKDVTGSKPKKVRKSARDGDVAKIGVGALANGFEAGMRKLPGIGGLAPKMKAAAGAATSTPKRKLATATAGGALVGAGANRMAKRDSAEDIDVLWAGEFSKFDEDQRLVFGWASVVEVNGMPVVDRQGDYIHPDDLENASYEYVIKSRVGGDMHTRDGAVPFKVSDLVESMVFTKEKVAKMGLPPEAAEKIPTGWWVGFKVHSDEHWDMVKKRARTGFSIHGRGKRVPTTMDSLVPGYH